MFQIKQLKTAFCFVLNQKKECYISLLNLEELSHLNRRLVNLLIAEFWSIVLINGQVLFWYVFSQVCLCSLVSVRKDSLLWRVSSHIGFMGFVVSQVSYFSRFCGFFRSFVVSLFHSFLVSKVSWLHTFRAFMGFVVSMVSQVLWVSWFQRFRGFMSVVVSWVSWFHRFHGFLAFMGLICFCSFEQTYFLC